MKLKLLSAEPTTQMISAVCSSHVGEQTKFGKVGDFRLMHAAAPTDATKRLIAVLMETQALIGLIHTPQHEALFDEVEALLKELCDD